MGRTGEEASGGGGPAADASSGRVVVAWQGVLYPASPRSDAGVGVRHWSNRQGGERSGRAGSGCFEWRSGRRLAGRVVSGLAPKGCRGWSKPSVEPARRRAVGAGRPRMLRAAEWSSSGRACCIRPRPVAMPVLERAIGRTGKEASDRGGRQWMFQVAEWSSSGRACCIRPGPVAMPGLEYAIGRTGNEASARGRPAVDASSGGVLLAWQGVLHPASLRSDTGGGVRHRSNR